MSVYYATIDYHSDEASLDLRAVLAATAREATSRGALPLFVFTQWSDYCVPSDGDAELLIEHNLFDGLGVTHVRADAPPDTFDPSIMHLNTRGHRVIADVIERSLGEHGIAGAPATGP